MIVASIDPGTSQSALVLWDGRAVLRHAILPNPQMIEALRMPEMPASLLVAIEQVRCYGQSVGQSVLDTCMWTGRFAQVCDDRGHSVRLVPRMDVKMAICHSSKAKDTNIRRALLDRLGKETTKGITTHCWAALALAVTVYDRFSAPAEIEAPASGDVLLSSPLGSQQLACGNRVPVENPTTIRVQ